MHVNMNKVVLVLMYNNNSILDVNTHSLHPFKHTSVNATDLRIKINQWIGKNVTCFLNLLLSINLWRVVTDGQRSTLPNTLSCLNKTVRNENTLQFKNRHRIQMKWSWKNGGGLRGTSKQTHVWHMLDQTDVRVIYNNLTTVWDCGCGCKRPIRKHFYSHPSGSSPEVNWGLHLPHDQ